VSANHHDPKTSKKPARANQSPTTGWAMRYAATRSGLLGICGRREPTADAAARRSRSTRAVRIERKVLHTSAIDCRSVGPGGR
jgi:hypothetical protein